MRSAPNGARKERLRRLDASGARYQYPSVSPHRSGWEPAAIYTRSKKLAEDVGQLPRLKRSPDPGDNYLLALAEASKADYLVTGDKSGLLVLARHKSARIITARDFAGLFAADAS